MTIRVNRSTIPSVYCWVPAREQGGDLIPGNGYDRIHAMTPQWPQATPDGVRDLEIVVAESYDDATQLQMWKKDYDARMGLQQKIHVIVNHSGKSYFDAIRSTPVAMAWIADRRGAGAFFRPYEWDYLMDDDAKSLGFPLEQCYNRWGWDKRLSTEFEPIDMMEMAKIPDQLVAMRTLVPGAPTARTLVDLWRSADYAGQILMDIEDDPGGINTAVLQEGERTNPRVEEFFTNHQGENIVLSWTMDGQTQWSLQFERGYGGEPRYYGFHRKIYTPFQGRLLKCASTMGIGGVDGILAEHVGRARHWSEELVRVIYARGYVGSIGVVWRSMKGVSEPKLFRINLRDDSEIPLNKILEWIAEKTGKWLVGRHSRLYFRKHRWADLARLLDGALFTYEDMRGALIHAPYADKKRGCQTILLMQVAENEAQILEDLAAIKEQISAWAPGEDPK